MIAATVALNLKIVRYTLSTSSVSHSGHLFVFSGFEQPVHESAPWSKKHDISPNSSSLYPKCIRFTEYIKLATNIAAVINKKAYKLTNYIVPIKTDKINLPKDRTAKCIVIKNKITASCLFLLSLADQTL